MLHVGTQQLTGRKLTLSKSSRPAHHFTNSPFYQLTARHV